MAVLGGHMTAQDEEAFQAFVRREWSTLNRELLESWLDTAVTFSGLSLEDLRIDVRWAGTVNGQSAAAFTLQQPGQGVLAYAFHGDLSSARQDLGILMPAAGAADRPIVWRMRADGGDTRTNRVLMAAPSSAARLELVVEGAAPVPVTLDGSGFGEGTLAPDQKASVVAYRADGSRLNTTPVLPFDNEMTVVGSLPETRMVP
jgi:hypothetical protein